MICFSYSARASPSWSSANLLTTCFSVLLKSNGSHHGKATICPKKFFSFPEIRGIIRVPYASFLIPAKNFAVFWVKFAITIYPRKGTETGAPCIMAIISSIVTYPRKGTETHCLVISPVCIVYCNLSPQGDENRSISMVSTAIATDCNLSPQGDGNAPLSSRLTRCWNCNLSP